MLGPDGTPIKRIYLDAQPATPALPAAALVPGQQEKQLAEARKRLQEMQAAPGPLGKHAKRILQLLDLAAPSMSPAERHAQLRTLGFAVSKTTSDDGTLSTFTVNGRARFRVFALPGAPAHGVRPDGFIQPDGTGGPSALAGSEDDCYYDGQPEECATDQEKEDYVAWAYSVADEWAGVYNDVANTNWDVPDAARFTSGPSVDDNEMYFGCWGESAVALGSAGAAWATAELSGSAVHVAFTIARVAISWEAILVGSLVVAAVGATYLVYKCAAGREPADDAGIPRGSMTAPLAARF